MPRSGKRRHRLTKQEIRNIRRLVKRGTVTEETVPVEHKSYSLDAEIRLPSTLFISQKTNTHHKVFNHFYPSVRYYSLNYETIAFGNEKDRQSYEQWHDEYIKKFGEYDAFDFPPPVDGVYPYIESVYIENNRATVSKSLRSKSERSSQMEKWLWCLENCESEVRVVENALYFASEEDAALYRITFG